MQCHWCFFFHLYKNWCREFWNSLGSSSRHQIAKATRITGFFNIEYFSKDCPGTGHRWRESTRDVCVSHLSCDQVFPVLESQPSITVVFLAFPKTEVDSFTIPSQLSTVKWAQEALVSSHSLRRKLKRTSVWPTAPFYSVSTSSQQIFIFVLVPKSRQTLPWPVMAI